MDAGKEVRTFLDDPKKVKEFLKTYDHDVEKLNKDVTFIELSNRISSKGVEIFEDELFDGLDAEAKAAILLLALQNELDKPKVKKRDEDIEFLLNKVIEEIESPIRGIANTNFRSLFKIIHTSKDHDVLASYLTLLSMKDREPTTRTKKGEVLGWLIEAPRKDFTLSELLSYIDTIHSLSKGVIKPTLAEQLKVQFLRTMEEFNINKLTDNDLIDLSIQVAKFAKGGVVNERQASTLINKFMNKVSKNANVLKDKDDFYIDVLPFMSAPEEGNPHPLLAFIENNRRGAWMVINDVADVNDKGQHNKLLKSMLELQVKQKNFADVKGLGEGGKDRNGLFAALEAAKGDTTLQVAAFNEITKAREAKTAIIDAYWIVGRDGDWIIKNGAPEALETANAAFQSRPIYNKAMQAILADTKAAKALYESVKGDSKKLKALLSLEPITIGENKLAISGFIYAALSPEERVEFIANPALENLSEIFNIVSGAANWGKLSNYELINFSIQVAKLKESGDINEKEASVLINRFMNNVKKDASVLKGRDGFYKHVLPLISQNKPHPLLAFIENNRAGAWMVINDFAKDEVANVYGKEQHDALLKEMLQLQVEKNNFKDVKGGKGLLKALEAAKDDSDLQIKVFNAITKERTNQVPILAKKIKKHSSYRASQEALGYDQALVAILSNEKAATALYDSVKDDPKKFKELLQIYKDLSIVTNFTIAVDGNVSSSRKIESFIYEALDGAEKKAEFIRNSAIINPLDAILERGGDNFASEIYYNFTNDKTSFPKPLADLDGEVKKAFADRIMGAINSHSTQFTGKGNIEWFYKHVLPYAQHELIIKFIEKENAIAQKPEQVWETIYAIFNHEQMKTDTELLTKIIDQQIKDKAFISKSLGAAKNANYAAIDGEKLVPALQQINDPELNLRVFDEINRAMSTTKNLVSNREFEAVRWHVMNDKASVQELYARVKDKPKELAKLLDGTVIDPKTEAKTPMSSLIYQQLTDEQKAEFLRHEQVNPFEVLHGLKIIRYERSKKPAATPWVEIKGVTLIGVAAKIKGSNQLTDPEKDALVQRILAHIDYKQADFFGKPIDIPDNLERDLQIIGDSDLNVKVFKILAAGREKLLKNTKATTEVEDELKSKSNHFLWILLNDEATAKAIYENYKGSDAKMRNLFANTAISKPTPPFNEDEVSVDYLLYINADLDEKTVVEFLQNKHVDPMKILLDIPKDSESDIFNYVEFVSSYISAFPETKRYVDSFNKNADPIFLQIPNAESIKAKSMLELILKVDERNNNQYLITKFSTEVLVKDPKAKASAAVFGDRVQAISGVIDNPDIGLDSAQKHEAKLALYSAIMQDPAAKNLALNAKENLVDRKYMLLAALQEGKVEDARVFSEITAKLDTPTIKVIVDDIQEDPNVPQEMKLKVINAGLGLESNARKPAYIEMLNELSKFTDVGTIGEYDKLIEQFVQYTKSLEGDEAEKYVSALFKVMGTAHENIAYRIASEISIYIAGDVINAVINSATTPEEMKGIKELVGIMPHGRYPVNKVRGVLRNVAKQHPDIINTVASEMVVDAAEARSKGGTKKLSPLSIAQQAAILLGFADRGGDASSIYESVLAFQNTGAMSMSLTDAKSITAEILNVSFDFKDPVFVRLLYANTSMKIIKERLPIEDAVKLAEGVFEPHNPGLFNKFMVGLYEELAVSEEHAKQFLNANPGALFKAAAALKDEGLKAKLVKDLNAIKGEEKDEDFIRRVFASLDAETSMDKTDILDIKHRLFASQTEHTVGDLQKTWEYVGDNFEWIFELLPQSELERVIDGIISDSRAPRNGEIVQKSIISTLAAALTDDTVDEKALSIVIRMLNYSIGQGMLIDGLVELTKEMDEEDIRAFNEEITKIADNEVRKQMRTTLFNAIIDNERLDALVEIATVNITEGKTPSDHMKLDEIGRDTILAISDLLLVEVEIDAAKAISAELFKDIKEDGLKELLDAAKEKSPELAAFMAEQKPELFATILSTPRTAGSVFTYGDMYVFDKIIKEDGLTAVEAAERLLKAYNDPANKDNKNLRTAIETYYSKYVQQNLGKGAITGEVETDYDVEAIKEASPELIAKFFRKAAELEKAAKPKEEEFEFVSRGSIAEPLEEEVKSVIVTMEAEPEAAAPITTRPENLLVFDFKVLANIHEELAKKAGAEPNFNTLAKLFYELVTRVGKFFSSEDKELSKLAKRFEVVLTKEISFEAKVDQEGAKKHNLELKEKTEEIATDKEPKGFAAKIAQKADIVKKGISPKDMKEEDKGSSRER